MKHDTSCLMTGRGTFLHSVINYSPEVVTMVTVGSSPGMKL